MKSRNRVTNDDTRDERESEGNEIENDFSLFPFLHPFFPTIEEHLESNGWKIPFEPRNSGNENRGGEKKKKKRREKKRHKTIKPTGAQNQEKTIQVDRFRCTGG